MLELECHRRRGRSPARTRAEQATHRLLRAVVLLLALPWPVLPAAAQEPPDVRQAERAIEDACAELEEIVGLRLLGLDPPPLPEVPPLGLTQAEQGLVERLDGALIEEWSAGDRAGLAEILARKTAALSAAGSEGEPVAQADLGHRALPLLRIGRLLALRDRLALLEGREAAFADGLDGRLDLALRLALQPGIVGAIFGDAFHVRLLEDVRLATLREETSAETLERLDALLFRWQLEAPDPAAVLAREALTSLERTEREVEPRLLGNEAATLPAFQAPWLQDVAELARHCRREDCQRAVEAVAEAASRDDSPYRVIADLMIPNLLHTLKKLAGGEEIARIARVALALRLEAIDQGSYPATLERLAPELGLTPEQEGELAYERLTEGGARLRLTTDHLVTDAAERHQQRYRRLLTWELPPV